MVSFGRFTERRRTPSVSIRSGFAGTTTALIWRDRIGPLSTIATHDAALGSAARAFGFDVLGT